MRKFLLLLMCILAATATLPAATYTDVLTVTSFPNYPTSSNYGNYECPSAITGITYSAHMAGAHSSIQLNDSSSGIVITTNENGYKLVKVTVEWNSNTAAARKLDVYGKSDAYTAPSDLYNDTNKGTQLGSIDHETNQTELTIPQDKKFAYIGLRSKKSAMYISKLTLEWEDSSTPPHLLRSPRV